MNYGFAFPDEMNGLDPSAAALVDYVKACGIADPVAWLEENLGKNWQKPPRPADGVVTVEGGDDA